MGYTIALIAIYAVLALLIVYLLVVLFKKKPVQAVETKSEGVTINVNVNEPLMVRDHAPIEVQQIEEAAVVEGNVGFNANKLTFMEAYELLDGQQKGYVDGLLEYAMSKEGAEQKMTKHAAFVTKKKKPILKLKIRRGVTVAAFKVESDLMRDFKRQAETTSGIKEKETEILVTTDEIYATARDMVDLMITQYERQRQEARDRIKAKRAARKGNDSETEE